MAAWKSPCGFARMRGGIGTRSQRGRKVIPADQVRRCRTSAKRFGGASELPVRGPGARHRSRFSASRRPLRSSRFHCPGMPYAIISDIHANLEALDVVLADIGARRPDAVVCLGDFVGYGPDPVPCVERVRPLLRAAGVGNPDVPALGTQDAVAAKFNPFAYEAVVWTRRQLTEPVRGYLEGLPRRATPDGC